MPFQRAGRGEQNDNAAGRLSITCCACEFRFLRGTFSDGGHATKKTSHLTQGALFLFAFFPSDLRAIRQDTYKGGILIKLRTTNRIERTQKHMSCCGTCSTDLGCRGWAGVPLPVHGPQCTPLGPPNSGMECLCVLHPKQNVGIQIATNVHRNQEGLASRMFENNISRKFKNF